MSKTNIFNNDKELIDKHLKVYTEKNTTDYFIHKDLKGFLTRELDFYIKNEVLHLDELGTEDQISIEDYITKANVIKSLCLKIIDFLAQIENFQKMLFEKKKFVLSTEYLITLDCIDEKYYSDILENHNQLEEWKNLYSFDIEEEIKKLNEKLIGFDNEEEEKKIKILKKNPTLCIDTKFFDINFKYDLLSNIDDIDRKKTGLLINSENFQALNLLANKYKNEIKCCYIDPPYNTGNDGFLYKDGFSHSSWLSMIDDRASLTRNLLKNDGAIFTSIDENELYNLKHLYDKIFDFINMVTINTKVAGVSGSHHGKSLKNATENILIYSKDKTNFSFTDKVYDTQELCDFIKEMKSEGKSWKYTTVLEYVDHGEYLKSISDGEGDEIEIYQHRNYSFKSVNKFAKEEYDGDLKKAYYENVDKIFRTTNAQSSIRQRVCESTEEVNSYLISINYVPKSGKNKGEKITLYYKDNQRNLITFLKDVVHIENDKVYKKISSGNLWLDIEYNNLALEGGINFNNGKKPVKMISKIIDMSCNNNNDIILDFFAGSGTTGHAVLKLNKKNNNYRKFILVEMDKYFDTVLKPRIGKIIYSNNWKNGYPQDKDGYKKQFVKYQKFEQYEDTLNNIDFKTSKSVQRTLHEMDGYFLRYMLDYETRDSSCRLNVDKLDKPFSYTLKITEGNELKEKTVDLVETFNYLLGLHVKQIKTFTDTNGVDYKVIFGYTDENSVLVIWRDTDNLDLTSDKEFIENNIVSEFKPSLTYINSDFYVESAKPIEPDFKTLMGA